MRILLVVVLAVAGCGADPSDLSKPDLVMRDVAMMPPNECANGFSDGEETDQDCGGPTCMPCDTGKGCKMGRDCQSGSCTNRVCDAPSCADGIKNGRETDIDCGGGTCSGCELGKPCVDGPDCKSMTCKNAMCAPSPCTNMLKDGTETDVDCGGGSCPACGDGKMCQQGSDCVGTLCTNNVCKGALMCMAGTADCDGNAANGCEVNTDTDAKNCGGCGKVCAMGMPNCAGGKCASCGNDCWGPSGCLTGAGRCIQLTCRPGNAPLGFCNGCKGWKDVTSEDWLQKGVCADVLATYRLHYGVQTQCGGGVAACCASAKTCAGDHLDWVFFDAGKGTGTVSGPYLAEQGGGRGSDCNYWSFQEHSNAVHLSVCVQ